MSSKVKKGQTLVEIVVALSVLIVVLTTTVTLIINAVDLVLISRTKTEAITIAQKGLTEGLLAVQGTCQIKTASTIINRPLIMGSNKTSYNLTVSLRDILPNEGGPSPKPIDNITSDKFRVVVSTVTWTDKRQTRDSSKYEISQMVGIGQ